MCVFLYFGGFFETNFLFETKNIYNLMHFWLYGWASDFQKADFQKQDYFFADILTWESCCNQLHSWYCHTIQWSNMCIVCQGVQCHTWKKHIPTKSQFSHKMTLLKSQQKSQSHLKSNFLFTPISNICLEKFSSWLE